MNVFEESGVFTKDSSNTVGESANKNTLIGG